MDNWEPIKLKGLQRVILARCIPQDVSVQGSWWTSRAEELGHKIFLSTENFVFPKLPRFCLKHESFHICLAIQIFIFNFSAFICIKHCVKPIYEKSPLLYKFPIENNEIQFLLYCTGNDKNNYHKLTKHSNKEVLVKGLLTQ